MSMTTECFALLDDASPLLDGATVSIATTASNGATDTAAAAVATSRLYTDHLATLRCDAIGEWPQMLAAMQAALARGEYAVTLCSYELGGQLLGIDGAGAGGPPATPLARVLLFRRCALKTAAEVGEWLAARSSPVERPAGIANVRANLDQPAFDAALARIHAYIEAGDTYQVNYTMRLRFDAFGDVHALYARLRERQPVPYGALVQLDDGSAVLSLSPELFVRHAGGVLTARPMKGTAPAAQQPADDQDRARALAADPKNRAENLMIVDLLRNDIARVAHTGSVQVPALFDVQRYGSVLQMTSTISATLRADATLAQVFEALYPCGSITGAPKRRAMEIIRELEPDPRGIYTGAIGWFDPAVDAKPGTLGDFCLAVPIRTLALAAPDAATGVSQGEMGVGAGIVYDSASGDEYDECRLKARFLTGLPNHFEIFETMLVTPAVTPVATSAVTPADGVRHRARHLRRMAASAAYFGFAWDDEAAIACLDAACAVLAAEAQNRLASALTSGLTSTSSGVSTNKSTNISTTNISTNRSTNRSTKTSTYTSTNTSTNPSTITPTVPQPIVPAFRLRLALTQSGAFTVQHAPLAPLQEPVRLLLAADTMAAGDLFLRHKTSIRSRYDQAWRDAEAQGAFDTLFFNQRGELTEGGRSSVFIQLDGRWLTPALHCGVLPGVMRGVLLDDPAWQATEAVITRAMLARAQQLVVCNALRGAIKATL